MNTKFIVTENELKNIVYETVHNIISKREILNHIFDLTKIPVDSLRKQHYDISLMNVNAGFDNPLMKNNNGYINENNIIYSEEDIKSLIFKKYNFEEWQFRIIHTKHNIDIYICIANKPSCIECLKQDMEQLGYFSGLEIVGKDTIGQEWIKLQFEPFEQQDESEEILSYEYLYHITPSYNLSSIARNGLQPKSENSVYNYPNRIYLLRGDTPSNVMQNLAKSLHTNNRNAQNNGEYKVLGIKTDNLPQGIKFYYDVNSEYGVFTEESIPLKAIFLYANINFK